MSYLYGTFSYQGIPYDGAVVSVWSISAFSTSAYPQFDTPLPSQSYFVTSGVTSVENGGAGSYRLSVAGGIYFVSFEAKGHVSWAIEEVSEGTLDFTNLQNNFANYYTSAQSDSRYYTSAQSDNKYLTSAQ
ncbi:MAG: hypothetical protein JRN22_01885, partial [Nitrososphaerota archaeon]|nr:hypothetical protein [Nitrososphaerota archaeon]